jgi:hypothetical protein
VVPSHIWLFALAGLLTLSGLIAGVWSDGSGANAQGAAALAVFPIYIFTYLWMKADARERATQCQPGATPLIVGLYPIAVLYHLIATRPGWRKAVAALWFLGFVALLAVLNSIATYVGHLLAT